MVNANPEILSVALVGAGYISDFHCIGLNLIPNVEIQAICDLSIGRAQQLAESRGIKKVYSDLDEMIEHEKLDVIHILTPPHIHYTIAEKALRAGIDVMVEKPLCHTLETCQKLRSLADEKGCSIGVSHNFLFSGPYEQLLADWRSGRLGKIDQLDIVWNKELGQVVSGPFNAWMLQKPTNILFETCPHSFAYLIHLLGGMPDSIVVDVRDRVELPRGLEFYQRWEVRGWKGNTSIRLRFSFIDGYPEHYIHVRGSNGVARADIENDTYSIQEHIPQQIDLDRYANVVVPAWNLFKQANTTLGKFVLSKAGVLKSPGAPFADSIAGAIANFYQGRGGSLDHRVSADLGEATVAIGEWVARESGLVSSYEETIAESSPVPTTLDNAIAEADVSPNVLVIGGTGFIGRVLVRHLSKYGYAVRVLARDPKTAPVEFKELGVDLVKGDFTQPETVKAALEGIEYVYHLARGFGKTWDEYLKLDVEPTLQVAEICLQHNVKRLFYTSSIAIYDAGNTAVTITENTKPHPGVMRVNPYARSKVENERRLLDLHRKQGLGVVIFRPAVVLGRGGSPYHWGVAAWPFTSVCRLWGDGNDQLPIVLVDDLADAMVRAIAVPGIEGESYNLTSPPSITANEYLDELEQTAKIKLKRVPTQGWRYYAEALGKWTIKKLGKDKNAAFPSYADGQGRSFASPFSSQKAENELGWRPTKDRDILIKEGIHEPVREFLG